MPNTKRNTNELESSLTNAIAHAAQIEAEAKAEREQLERALQLARGTGDVREQAAQAVKLAKPRTLGEQIVQSLQNATAPLMTEQLAKTLGVSVKKIDACMHELRDQHRVYNLSTEDHPRWVHVIGDDATSAELNARVVQLIGWAPLMLTQLQAATGIKNRNRVSGALVVAQRDPDIAKRLENLGNDRAYVWFLPAKKR